MLEKPERRSTTGSSTRTRTDQRDGAQGAPAFELVGMSTDGQSVELYLALPGWMCSATLKITADLSTNLIEGRAMLLADRLRIGPGAAGPEL